MSSLTQILINAGSGDSSVRDYATAQLDSFEKGDFAQYVAGLCGEFVSEERQREVRLLAALQLKNALIRPKNAEQSLRLAERWLRLPETIRVQAKAMILQTLASREESVRSQAARVVAAVASIEVPKQQWNDIINILVQSIAQTGNDGLRQAGFEALGYVCEEVPEYLQDKSNVVLNAIAIGLHPDLKDTKIKLAATRALVNSMNFVKENFRVTNERDTIMRMIYSVATYMEDVNVRVAAFSALVEVASSYYEYLSQYIAQIYVLTSNAIANEKEEVQLQAIEFWSTLCDEEIELLFDEEDGKPDIPCQQYIAKAFPQLSPLLFNCLTKQSGNLDEQQWDVATAAATCLGLCAQAAKDAVIAPVLMFVQQNIVASDWHMEEAAILAFGSILDGPKKENLQPLVSQALPLILSKMSHKHPLVKDTTAWTLGRICQLVPETITAQILPQLMTTFVNALADVPKVAANVCWAMHNLALSVEKNEDSTTSPLSSYMEGLMKALLNAANRTDVDQSNLLCSIYEAINILISTAATDVFPLINHLIPELLNRLNRTITASGNASEEHNEVQALLCASLAVIIQKFSPDMIKVHADALMFHFLRVLSSKSATVLEEAFMAIGYIANRVESGFERYMSALKPFLLLGLGAADQTKLCLVSVGLIGDISRAIGPQFIAMGDEVVKTFLEHLQSSTIDRSVKPHIIAALGDIALALRGNFDRYLVHVMRMLQQASLTTFPENQRDEDNIEYLQMLRESILEAYTGILQGLGDEKKAELFAASPNDGVQHVVSLLELIFKERTFINDPILRASCGLIGDILQAFGAPVAPLLRRPALFELIDGASKSNEDQTRKAAHWASTSLTPYMS